MQYSTFQFYFASFSRGFSVASFYDGPNHCDDADFRPIRYRQAIPDNHPVRLIEQFISGLDISPFEQRYHVGDGFKGRPPKEIRMMLSVILYAIYSRIYTACRIDEATQYQADFWFLTGGERISHDKLSDFVNLHEEDLHAIFLNTIYLAHENSLLDFSGLYQDGFLLKANAGKRRSHTMSSLTHKERRISDRLDVIFQEMQDHPVAPCVEQEKKRIEGTLARLAKLREQLNERILQRKEGKDTYKAREAEQKTTINETDADCDLMRQKDDSIAASYLKVCASDPKADIIIASTVSGCNDEAVQSLPLFEQANANCDGRGNYTTVIADSAFTTIDNCEKFEQNNAQMLGPTRAHEHEKRCAQEDNAKPTFTYDQQQHCVHCSQGAILQQDERYYDKYDKATIAIFSNKEACAGCAVRDKCTGSKLGYRRVRVNLRCGAQQRTLERYKSESGQLLYRKRSHVGETTQGDLKHNGRFHQLLRRGIAKVKVDSLLLDIVWNLRRIFNTTGGKLVWA
jgi:transposase